jgi:hypothetical protein
VVIGNLATATVRLDNWRLVDKNGRTTPINALHLDPGGSALVALDGTGVQLSNAGGNLRLLDPTGRQADAVVFTATDTATEDHFVRFH